MKIAFKNIPYYQKLINSLLTEEEHETTSQSKLKYARNKWEKVAKPIIEEISKAETDVYVEHAEEDPKKKTLYVDAFGNYEFTRENTIKRNEAIRALHDKEFEFEPYLFTDQERIATMDPFVVEELTGIFLSPQSEQ